MVKRHTRSEAEIDREFRYRILSAEHDAINGRREAHKRPSIAPPMPADEAAPQPMFDTTGVCLSGGGIRSASFCLGALQALAVHGLIDKTDYLSTVSGGGYIGSSVSATMAGPDRDIPPGGVSPPLPNSDFPFVNKNGYRDTQSLGHLRDYSNYILPRGNPRLFDAVAIVLRGLVANAIFVGAFVTLLASATVFAYRGTPSLLQGSFVPRFLDAAIRAICLPGLAVFNAFFGAWPFAFTVWALAILGLILAAWAVGRSRRVSQGDDVRGGVVRLTNWLIFGVLILAWLDLQPVAIWGAISLKDYIAHGGMRPQWLEGLVGAAAALSAAATFFRNNLAGLLKSAEQQSGPSAIAKIVFAHVTLWSAALVLPLLIWFVYLWISALAIQSDNGWVALWWGHPLRYEALYLGICVILFVLTFRLSPNANSLHKLYRDKLSKAFLFDPGTRMRDGPKADAGDLLPLDKKSLPQISPPHGGPYQLVNAALNLQSSKYANRRGRDATFFLFSSKFVGSDVTGYVDAAKMHGIDPNIDLGTAMAISGAAVSPDMGSVSVRALAPTLALLNARLGYWMANPLDINDTNPNRLRRILFDASKFYLWAEAFGLLNENRPLIYLTDGGHIENLGLYELLKRRCRAIVVIDGEADPTLQFPSFSTLQRYARIDLGVRIDVRWQKISEVSDGVTKDAEDGSAIPDKNGPHCALGVIHYPNGEDGLLLYVKASISGDEADYVMNYKKRHTAFPHESTGDQFFSEEQFENYRALGFHAAEGFFSDTQEFEWLQDGPLSGATSPADARAEFLKLFA